MIKSKVRANKTIITQFCMVSLLAIFCGLFVYSVTTQASEISPQDDTSKNQCPSQFNQLEIPNDGKLCQIFAADFPASMIFFVPKTPQDVIDFYLAGNKSLSATKKVKERTLLQTSDKNTTLIISKDGAGTQIDILIKQPIG